MTDEKQQNGDVRVSEPERARVEDPALLRLIAAGAELARRIATDPEFAAACAKRDAEIQTTYDEQKRIAEDVAVRLKLASRGIPALFAEVILKDKIKPTEAMRVVRAFQAQEEKRLLVMVGRPGCGKSLASAWLVAQPIACDYQGVEGAEWPTILHPRFVDVGTVLTAPLYGEGSEIGDLWRRCSLLVVDDIGLEYSDAKGAWTARFDQLFNARYAANLRTVFTTNLTPMMFREQYGPRIADRVRDAAFGGGFANVDAQSLRGQS